MNKRALCSWVVAWVLVVVVRGEEARSLLASNRQEAHDHELNQQERGQELAALVREGVNEQQDVRALIQEKLEEEERGDNGLRAFLQQSLLVDQDDLGEGKPDGGGGNKNSGGGKKDNGSSGKKDNGSSGKKDNGSSGKKDNGSSGKKDNGSSGKKDNGSSGKKDNGSSGKKDNGSSGNKKDNGGGKKDNGGGKKDSGSSGNKKDNGGGKKDSGSSGNKKNNGGGKKNNGGGKKNNGGDNGKNPDGNPGNGCKKVWICHCPPGNENNCHSINICEEAVDDHIGHHPGDHMGRCRPTKKPTEQPTSKPTPSPFGPINPINQPTRSPTASPTARPTKSQKPTAQPTERPTKTPKPTRQPTNKPTPSPFGPINPITQPTASPTRRPTKGGNNGGGGGGGGCRQDVNFAYNFLQSSSKKSNTMDWLQQLGDQIVQDADVNSKDTRIAFQESDTIIYDEKILINQKQAYQRKALEEGLDDMTLASNGDIDYQVLFKFLDTDFEQKSRYKKQQGHQTTILMYMGKTGQPADFKEYGTNFKKIYPYAKIFCVQAQSFDRNIAKTDVCDMYFEVLKESQIPDVAEDIVEHLCDSKKT